MIEEKNDYETPMALIETPTEINNKPKCIADLKIYHRAMRKMIRENDILAR